MFGVVSDICESTGWKIEYVNSFPRSIIDAMWQDYIIKDWYHRGTQEGEKAGETDADKFERLKQMAGANYGKQ